ncbi:DNA methyltransferase [Actinoplanes cyaneus]|uniref:site-specific DNA-methyltransferase (adenine-specific) n=2 Tax=Actinoplanes cyaneus TaxID=52696 RepID=A0A919IJ99_9ACTN|nr:DNA methyltransferase [Actinoplanes cyaneus]
MSANALRPAVFLEPFAGGAATTLRLLVDGVVPHALIADADPLVSNFWIAAAKRPEWLVERMLDEPVTLERWDYWRGYSASSPDDPELAVKCLFLNRTTFSGILHGRAGPIGGRKQESEYKINCRFNKPALAERIRLVGSLYESGKLLDVWRQDWKATFEKFASTYGKYGSDDVVSYLDPPYVDKAARLYTTAFGDFDHKQLAEYLNTSPKYRWVLSYDDHPDIRELYGSATIKPEDSTAPRWRIQRRLVQLLYSASGSTGRGLKSELIISTLPKFPAGEDFKDL